MDETENLKVMSKCPRFPFCDVPICPLDYYKRVKLEGEPSCSLAKSIRKKIGKGTKLKYQGMTSREFLGAKRWEEKSETEKKSIISRLVPFVKKKSI